MSDQENIEHPTANAEHPKPACGLMELPADPFVLGLVLEFIFVAIVNDAGKHGDFLKAFARAYLRADHENRKLIEPSAVALVQKYGLIKHFQGHAE